ncbi:hypothetical protein ABW20_dc0102667 [Dactylellina cionopaga]|nr:hypothetical protein ABW20_dc0102667 [Dactylellina cionopaga]
MSSTYHIIFRNHYAEGNGGNYIIFSAPPIVSGETSDPKVFVNVWTSDFINNGDNLPITVNTSLDYYACTYIFPTMASHWSSKDWNNRSSAVTWCTAQYCCLKASCSWVNSWRSRK